MPFTIVRQDITKMQVDAIVNAANTQLAMGGGVCGSIFKAAGADRMREACDRLAPIPTGGAAITPGFDLPAGTVIHAAGPVYNPLKARSCARLLRAAYLNSLDLAEKNGCESIAFPLISSGIYGYPKQDALKIATSAIRDYLADHEMNIYLAVFDKASFAVSKSLLGEVESYIDDHYVEAYASRRRQLLSVECEGMQSASMPPSPAGIDALMQNLDEPFNATLLRLVDEKGMTDVEVYKRANIDRKLFSKIRTGKGYMPGKRTVLSLAIALRLDLAQTDALLKCAGYALSHSQKFDVIVEYFIISERYDIFEINEVLFEYDQPLLGS